MAEYAHLHCSFCGKSAVEVKKLIAGPDIYICNECVDKCYGILNEGATSGKKTAAITHAKASYTPREIKEFLDTYVIGQDDAKETLAVAVYNHYKRLDNPIIDDVEIDKGNLLMYGSTGSGKTLLAQSIARMLDVPFTIVDATTLTQAGYVGEDVETIIGRLLSAAENDAKRCERGIIFIDEIDKKAAKQSAGTTPDVGGEGVQQALLKMLEGAEILVPPNGLKKNPATEMVRINTKNILFIVAGAFVGLDKIVARSLTKESSMGINSKTLVNKVKFDAELLKKVEPEHLITFGLIPELVGRLPIIMGLEDLTEAQLVRILTEPKNALVRQYVAMFKLDGIDLEFDPETLYEIAKIAKKNKTGGRGLRGVIESKLRKTQFNLPDYRKAGAHKIVVHPETITQDVGPEIFY